jgi:hypothetical protein
VFFSCVFFKRLRSAAAHHTTVAAALSGDLAIAFFARGNKNLPKGT